MSVEFSTSFFWPERTKMVYRNPYKDLIDLQMTWTNTHQLAIKRLDIKLTEIELVITGFFRKIYSFPWLFFMKLEEYSN